MRRSEEKAETKTKTPSLTASWQECSAISSKLSWPRTKPLGTALSKSSAKCYPTLVLWSMSIALIHPSKQLTGYSEGLYQEMRGALLGRLHDKEPQIRAISAASLAKLLPTEEPDDVTEGETSLLEALVDALKYDTSPEVRRAALVNIHVTADTIPHLLTRTRDLDSGVRKHTYSTVLERNCNIGEGEDSKSVGHAHPRFLSIEHREMVIKHGLGDREPSVRAAAANLVGTWVDVMRNPDQIVKNETPAQELEQTMLSFLTLFDLQEVTIPEEALMSVFKTRAEIFDNLEFGDVFWENLTPEKTFLARVFVDQCVAAKNEARLEAALSVVTAMAFRIQGRYNDLMALIQDEMNEEPTRLEDREEERIRREEERMSQEFILTELLKLAVNLDYADEIGRRKMFQLVRAMIAHQALPEGLASRCLDVLRKLSDSERDLIMVVVEVIHELRDTEEPDDEAVVSSNPCFLVRPDRSRVPDYGRRWRPERRKHIWRPQEATRYGCDCRRAITT